MTKRALEKTIKELSELSQQANAIFYMSYVSDLIDKNTKACFGKGYLNPEKKIDLILKGAAKVGEPWISLYDEKEIEKMLFQYGFSLKANKTLSDLNSLYFSPFRRELDENQIFNIFMLKLLINIQKRILPYLA